MGARINKLINAALGVLAPPPKRTVSQWADRHRQLSPEASASPGLWRTHVVEYMREPMDCIGDPRVRQIVIMAGAQVAKTEVILNALGKAIHDDPAPILIMQPTLEMAEAFSKDRVAPMVRDSKVLRERVGDTKSRDSGNTILHKTFPGGHLTMVGANAPAGLASRPIRDVYCDEVDRYPLSAGTEGDPITLAVKRTLTFWNSTTILTSTPLIKGVSRIEAAFLEGDQRRLWCPCPDCETYQVLQWSQVWWSKDKSTKAASAQTARYTCIECGSLWTDAQRVAAVRRGQWRAGAEFNGVASFHVPGLLSPFSPLWVGVLEFLESQKDPSRLQVWTNTFLGETWEEKGARLDSHELSARAEEWETAVPVGVTLITAGIDVQDDRIEIEVVGWGDDYESWALDWHAIQGDPTGPAVWSELALYLKQTWEHPEFGELSIRAACLDTGHHTQQCYAFARATSRVFAVKGIGGDSARPVIGKASRNNLAKIPLFPIGTHTAKKLVTDRLKVQPGEAGYCNFPKDRDIEYYRQMTAEAIVTRYHRGFKKEEWNKVRTRNEAFDCRIYATAALELLSIDIRAQRRAAQRDAARRQAEAETGVEAKPKRHKSQGNYVNRWKGAN